MQKTFDIRNCCGCEACVQICPKQCITLNSNSEGFSYPIIDSTKCIMCHSCTKVCPSFNNAEKKYPLLAYAAINDNMHTRMDSSSGGLFSLFAEQIIKRGGVVFGARFDSKWNVVHDYVSTIDELKYLRGSKYVQSHIEKSFKKVKFFLAERRFVLFCGTPCQIAGLKRYLGKDNDFLYTIDFICHGVPSPMIWQWYLDNLKKMARWSKTRFPFFPFLKPMPQIENIEFRNKMEEGWKKYHLVFSFLKCSSDDKKGIVLSYLHYKNAYMSVFLNNLILRPSCYQCPVKQGRSNSDITLADFWNVHQVIQGYDDDKGTSLVLINSERGRLLFEELKCQKCQVEFEKAIQYNKAWFESCEKNPNRNVFFSQYKKHPSDFHLYVDSFPPSFMEKIRRSLIYRYHLLKSKIS